MKNLLIPVLFISACGASTASDLAHEPFVYSVSQPLTNANGGSGWTAAWYEDGQALPALVREGLSYTDATGNQLHVSGGAATTASTATTRSFRSIQGGPINDVWISFLWHLPGSNSLFEGVTFYRGAEGVFTVSNPSTTVSSAIVLGNSVTGGTANSGKGSFATTHLIVLRLGKGQGANGGDLVEIYVDPLLSGSPSSPDATISASNFDFDTLRLAGQNGAPFHLDELRIGSSYASVTPHDPVPSGDLDTDGDGITDAEELILGTDPRVSNAALFDSIRNHPQFFDLYDAQSILLQKMGGIVIQKESTSIVPFSLEIQQSRNLLLWSHLETITRSVELPTGKNFLRVTLEE